MKSSKKILLILNTVYHVEVLVGLHFTLLEAGYECETYLTKPISEFSFKIEQLLDKLQIKWQDSGCPQFDFGIVITLQTKINDAVWDYYHPIIQNNLNKLIYIPHAVSINPKSFVLKNKKILTLTPISKEFGFEYIYLSNSKEISFGTTKENISPNIVVQAHFERKNRNWDILLKLDRKKYQINVLGTRIPLELKGLENINIYENLSEIQFNSLVKNATFLFLPIDETTHNGTYLEERVSSTIVHAQLYSIPLIWNKKLAQIYNLPGLEYEKVEDLNELINNNIHAKFDFLKTNEMKVSHNLETFNRLFSC